MLGTQGTLLGDAAGSDGYVSSAESRTIWVSFTPAQFATLFGTTPFQGTASDGEPLYYWNGSLSLPDTLDIAGLWFDTVPWFGTPPAMSDLSGGAVADLHQGVQSIGNFLTTLDQKTNLFPGEMADWFYHFPLSGIAARTAESVERAEGSRAYDVSMQARTGKPCTLADLMEGDVVVRVAIQESQDTPNPFDRFPAEFGR